MSGDLTDKALAPLLPGRPLRAFPALLSTEAEALAWARSGAPDGAVVVAGYQASPRGRAGRPWKISEGEGLGFSLILHPDLPPEREGWLYTVAACALAEVLGDDAAIRWPDEVRRDGAWSGGVGVQTHLGLLEVDWAVVNLMVEKAGIPRGSLLAHIVEGIEERSRLDPQEVLRSYLPRLETLGRRVRARLIPLGPAGPQVEGTAVDARPDGALVLETESGSRVAVRPQHLGMLEDM
ncbi:MAG: hypothetical protein M3N51_06615 [Actinomycetota bacterium]|nr:hypothetical protein [Actinomycetota bacterium]